MSQVKRDKNMGGDNYNAKCVQDDEGNVFDCVQKCAQYHNIHTNTVTQRVKRGIYKFIP